MKSLCVLLLAGGTLAGFAPAVQAQRLDGIQAIVHDSVITHEDIREAVAGPATALQQDYGNQQDVFQKKLAEVVSETLEQKIETQLILHEFQTAGYQLSEKYIDDYVDQEVRSSKYGGDRMKLIKTLEAQGTTLEKFRQHLREAFIERVMREKFVTSEVIISPHKVELYYQEHHENFKLEDEVKMRVIVLNKAISRDDPDPKGMANEILAKLKDGVSFAELATLYSQGSQRREGGDWGWRPKSYPRKELADVAFALKPGEHSGVIETSDGYYIVQVDETRPAHYLVLADVRDQIEKDLQAQERSRLQKQWIAKLKKKTFVVSFQ
jgi:parvulin-like peptidyl-prolyl isomerase